MTVSYFDRGPSLQDVSAYLKQLPCREVEPMQQGSQLLDDDVVSEIEKAVDAAKVGETPVDSGGDSIHAWSLLPGCKPLQVVSVIWCNCRPRM